MADAEFARRAGLTKATMSRKMSGASKFFAEDVVAAARVLGWSTAHLMMEIEAEDASVDDLLDGLSPAGQRAVGEIRAGRDDATPLQP